MADITIVRSTVLDALDAVQGYRAATATFRPHAEICINSATQARTADGVRCSGFSLRNKQLQEFGIRDIRLARRASNILFAEPRENITKIFIFVTKDKPHVFGQIRLKFWIPNKNISSSSCPHASSIRRRYSARGGWQVRRRGDFWNARGN